MHLHNRKALIRETVCAIIALLIFGSAFAADTPSAVSGKLRSMVDDLRQNKEISISDQRIVANRLLIEMYMHSGYRPLWQNASTAEQLIGQIRMSAADGLDPEAYHLGLLAVPCENTGKVVLTPQRQAERDLLLGDAFIRLAFHLYYGKVDPRSQNPRWPLPAYIGNQAAVDILTSRVQAGQVDAFLASLRPDHPMYQRLMRALASYRDLANTVRWPRIPPGPLIEKGIRDAGDVRMSHGLPHGCLA